uniref:Uncharacterized protein n=1 Tax=Arundo donax TaxID=35708 RepID=A0A0A9H3W9_ARUDO
MLMYLQFLPFKTPMLCFVLCLKNPSSYSDTIMCSRNGLSS